MKGYLVVIAAIVLSGCSAKPMVVTHSERYTGTGQYDVYVVIQGEHTGLVVPSLKAYESMPSLKQHLDESEFVEFGWGDKGYYMAKEITFWLGLRALFWPTESVIRAAAVPQNVSDFYPDDEVRRICLNEKELSSLMEFITKTFKRNGAGEMISLGHDKYGEYYDSVGNYHVMNTCNTWTAKGLRSVGMDISPSTKLVVESIRYYLDELDLALIKEVEPGDCLQCSCATTGATKLTSLRHAAHH